MVVTIFSTSDSAEGGVATNGRLFRIQHECLNSMTCFGQEWVVEFSPFSGFIPCLITFINCHEVMVVATAAVKQQTYVPRGFHKHFRTYLLSILSDNDCFFLSAASSEGLCVSCTPRDYV